MIHVNTLINCDHPQCTNYLEDEINGAGWFTICPLLSAGRPTTRLTISSGIDSQSADALHACGWSHAGMVCDAILSRGKK